VGSEQDGQPGHADPAAALPETGEYRRLQRRETRDTTLVAGVVGLVGLPLWAAFDRVLVPDEAGEFLVARVLGELAIIVTCGVLWRRRRTDERWAEALSFLTVLCLVVSVAWMVPRSGDQLEAYVLGLSLPIYATAFLLAWRWPMTVGLAGGTAAAIAVSSVGVDPGLDARQWTTTAFYMATATAMAIASQVYRERKRWQQHVTQTALEAERQRNAVLVEELEQLSREDPLTSVGNRRAWDERLTGEFLRARRSARPLAVLICDLDHFKAVNDRSGHGVGDAVLRTTTTVVAERLRSTDFLARIGGDEFAILCPDTSLAAAADLAADLRDGIRTADFADGVTMTCSIGVAELETRDDNAEVLSHRADGALYEAKVVRDTFRCAEPGTPWVHHSAGRHAPDRRPIPDPT
jgi:diguanylate cyclase (GGDEF)-like protein